VLPFAPAASDSSLARMGRELVITLSSALTGTAQLSTVEPLSVLASVRRDDGPVPLERARRLALSMGAAHLVHGTLIRSDDRLRLELGVYETEGLRLVGRETVSAPRLDALTDSATLAVIRLLWGEGPPGPPSPGAVATRSVEALQAYLDGERAIAAGEWRQAPEHFARAVAADSSYWFAYWRLLLALEYHGATVDSVIRARVWEHRAALPERDRLLIEARSVTGSDRVARLREATTRFPAYWPAWWQLSEQLVHHGGYLGHTVADSRAALERTLELNPGFIPAWSHLFWVATAQRDRAVMARVLEELADARYGEVALGQAGINSLTYYRALYVLATHAEAPDSVIDAGAREFAAFRGPGESESIATGLLVRGFPAAQIRLSEEVLARGAVSPGMARAQQLALAYARAVRGAWDDALVAARAYAGSASRPVDLLLPFRIAVAGAWSGELDPEAAWEDRPPAGSPATADRELLAEIAWLDGVLALRTGNQHGLARARRALVTSGSRWSDVLARSFDTFETALSGDSAAAGRALATVVRQGADEELEFALGGAHPFAAGIQRLTAARWLLESGDTVTARSLLPWYESVTPGTVYGLGLANEVLAPPAIRLRRDLAAATGDTDAAAFLDARYRERRGEAPEHLGAANGAQPTAARPAPRGDAR
jgi:hypothetical protein